MAGKRRCGRALWPVFPAVARRESVDFKIDLIDPGMDRAFL
jgi:hypothetical protein